MPHMKPADRRKLVDTLQAWVRNAEAAVKCTDAVSDPFIALLKAPSDTPPGPVEPV